MKTLVAAAFVGSLIAGVSAAQAAPLAPASAVDSSAVIRVAGGCGPGWYRGPYGGCRPMGAGPVVVVPPVVVAPRVCPPGFFWRYGRCRPI